MATTNDVKNLIEAMAGSVEAAGRHLGLEADVKQGTKIELAMFMMYLAASDGEISWSEASLIGELCDLDLTPQSINSLIQENNIYSTEFENKAPLSLRMMITLDNNLLAQGIEIKDCTPIVIDTYEAIAKHFMKIDGSIDESEESDCHIYLNMLKRYADENQDRRKRSVHTFSKNTGSVSAPVKSGVTAPRKKG